MQKLIDFARVPTFVQTAIIIAFVNEDHAEWQQKIDVIIGLCVVEDTLCPWDQLYNLLTTEKAWRFMFLT